LGKETGDEFKRYNALDVSTTFEIFEKLRAKLPMVGMQDTYEADRKMLDLAGRMSRRGIRYDVEEAKVFKNSLEHRWKRWQAVLDGRVKRLFEWESKNPTRKLDTLKFDEAVNVMSPPQSKKLLYDLMGLPEQKLKDPKTGKMKVTTQQTKLLMLYPTILDREIKKILRAFLMLRGVRKLWSSYAKTKVGKDQRMRTTVNPGAAETGRWTASAFLIDYEGTNLQTVPPPWKRCFIADEGKLLFMADYSQIEARIVGYDAEDMDQIAIFEDPEGDIHKFNAARLLSIDIHDVTAHQRQYVGKSTHALNYDVGPRTLAEFTNKRGLESGIFVTVDFTREAKRLYLGTFDKVIRWQKRQWNKVKETKVLTNHLGRRRIFLGPTSGQFAYITRGEAIAFVPQSDVPDMLNIAMLRLDEIDDYNLELMLQAHDAVLGQADEDSVEEWSELVKKLMTVPLTIHGREMIVPVDIKVGKRWNKLTTVEKYLELR
jgi:DNA polymerase I-like protein with 3'-5' exonuclease and polymerase domains